MKALNRLFLALLALLALFALPGPTPAQVAIPHGVAVLSAPNPCATTTLTLNFAANGGSGVYCLNGAKYATPASVPGWSFSRTGQGYAERADGTLQLFATGVPRITDKGLLVEEARTNLVLWSQDFSNAAWSKDDITVSADAALAPDATQTADKLVPSTNSVAHRIKQLSLSVSGGSGAHGVWFKAAGYSKVALKEGSSSGQYATFDLSNGTVITSTSASASIRAFPNGYYLAVITVTGNTTQGFQIHVLAPGYTSGDPNSSTFAGDGSSGVLAWQADLQAAAFITSPIPTTSAIATRGADSASISSLSIAAPYSVGVSINTPGGYSDNADLATWNTVNDGGLIYESSLAVRPVVNEGGVATANLSGGNAVTGAAFKFAGRWALNDVNGSTNGSIGTHDTSSNPPTMTSLGIARALYGFGSKGNFYMRQLIVWNRGFADSELQGWSGS